MTSRPKGTELYSVVNTSLLTFKRGVQGAADEQILPALAKSLPTITNGGKALTFTLRPAPFRRGRKRLQSGRSISGIRPDMSGKGFPWAELDGRRVASDDLLQLALVNYGHFTSAQVRGGRVRGLAAHLARLDAASQELFGISIDGALVRERMLNALADTTDASLRVVVFPSIQTQRLSVLVVVREPIELTGAAQALKSVHYVRPVPHIKHVGTFAQIHYGEMAERAGFDDALLIDASGAILETTMSNIGFAVDSGIVWPHGPALEGVTMRLLEEALPSTRRHTRVDELTRVDGAFVTNSIGIAAVKRVDHVELTVDQRLMARLAAAYAAVPWDQL